MFRQEEHNAPITQRSFGSEVLLNPNMNVCVAGSHFLLDTLRTKQFSSSLFSNLKCFLFCFLICNVLPTSPKQKCISV